jgi:hypothetical protein
MQAVGNRNRRDGNSMTAAPPTSPVSQQHPMFIALAMLRGAAPADTTDPQRWQRWALLLSHVLAAVSRVPDTRDAEVAAVTASLLDRAGTYLKVQGRPREACPLLERALNLAEVAYGPHHPEVGNTLNDLALIVRDLGDLAGARPLAEGALVIAEAANAPDHPDGGSGWLCSEQTSPT